jgi:hypothetical protein
LVSYSGGTRNGKAMTREATFGGDAQSIAALAI